MSGSCRVELLGRLFPPDRRAANGGPDSYGEQHQSHEASPAPRKAAVDGLMRAFAVRKGITLAWCHGVILGPSPGGVNGVQRPTRAISRVSFGPEEVIFLMIR